MSVSNFDSEFVFDNSLLCNEIDRYAVEEKISSSYEGVINTNLDHRSKLNGLPRYKSLLKTTFPEYYMVKKYPEIYLTPDIKYQDVLEKDSGKIIELKMLDLTTLNLRAFGKIYPNFLSYAKDGFFQQLSDAIEHSYEQFVTAYCIVCLCNRCSHKNENKLKECEFLHDKAGKRIEINPYRIKNGQIIKNKLLSKYGGEIDAKTFNPRRYFYFNYMKVEAKNGRYEIVYQRHKELEKMFNDLHKTWSF